jgi:hypothetical protein
MWSGSLLFIEIDLAGALSDESIEKIGAENSKVQQSPRPQRCVGRELSFSLVAMSGSGLVETERACRQERGDDGPYP